MSSVWAGTEPLYLPGTVFTTEPPRGDHPMVNNRIPCSWLSLKGITYLLMCTSELEPNKLAKDQKQNQEEKQRTIQTKVLLLFGIHFWNQKQSAFA